MKIFIIFAARLNKKHRKLKQIHQNERAKIIKQAHSA